MRPHSRPFRVFAAAALVAVFSCLFLVVPQPAQAGPRSSYWRGLALTAINKFASRDTGAEGAGTYADAMAMEAALYGWGFSATLKYRDKALSLRKPDGGYGLTKPWDAFQDKSINPVETSYTVTTAGMGLQLLAGYRAGAVSAAEIQRLVDWVLAVPEIPVSPGRCVAYSPSPGDVKAPCVHNVSAVAGWFLMEAMDAGFDAPGGQELIDGIAEHTASRYRPATGRWPYMGDIKPDQDIDHNSFTVLAVYRFPSTHGIGVESARRHMTTRYTELVSDKIAHIRLPSLPPAPDAMSTTEPGVTLWCELGDGWFGEITPYVNSITVPRLAAMVAYMAAANSRACPQ